MLELLIGLWLIYLVGSLILGLLGLTTALFVGCIKLCFYLIIYIYLPIKIIKKIFG